YAAPIAALVIAAVIGGFYSGLEQRRFEAKHRIPESEWKTVRYSRIFNIRFPGNTLYDSRVFDPMTVDGSVPISYSWVSRREGFFFSATVFNYGSPPNTAKVFTLIRNLAGSGRTPIV